MKKYTFAIILLTLGLNIMAQSTYTEKIQRQEDGQGTLTIHMSKAIEDLVNGKTQAPAEVAAKTTSKAASTAKAPTRQVQDSIPDSTSVTKTSGTKIRVNGYRIQVYLGGNTRKGKNEAIMMGQRVKSLFSELPVYTHFVSPHWICRVGDFRTYEEANEYFRRMKATGRFEEAVIIRSKVTAYN